VNAAVLETVALGRVFGGLPAVQDVHLCVEHGERRLLIGPNGAGKTTLFNLIAGDLTPSSGSIRLFGRDVSRLRPDQRTHLGLARTYQIITVFAKSTLLHNVVLSLLGLNGRRWNPFVDLSADLDLAASAGGVLAAVGLEEVADRTPPQTSYGERRRLEIALALAQQPKLLLLDEPFAGLSTAERLEMRALLERIPREVTVVMVEHDMDVALAFADRITVMHHGKVVVEGSRAEVVADPRTREVYLGH
jgi:branched-chain amino acid transport system ATP-binding protein